MRLAFALPLVLVLTGCTGHPDAEPAAAPSKPERSYDPPADEPDPTPPESDEPESDEPEPDEPESDEPERPGLGPSAEATPEQRRDAVLALLTDGKTAAELTVVSTDDDKPFNQGLVRQMAPRATRGVVKLEMPTVEGDLAKEVVRRILRRQTGRMRACYDQGLQIDSMLRGTVTLSFGVDAEGAVEMPKVTETDLGNEAVGKCIAKVVRKSKFPRPADGKPATVSASIVLEPGGDILDGL